LFLSVFVVICFALAFLWNIYNRIRAHHHTHKCM